MIKSNKESNKMNFAENYNNIKKSILEELSVLEQEITALFQDGNPLSEKLSDFLSAPSKRLRPVLGFLFLKSVGEKINLNQHKVLLAVELVHNATLIHDDVIDSSEKRRSQKTLNAQFDENLAVVAGDFLLSIALEKIIETKSIEALEVFTSALKSTCMGEINQYFSKFNITSIEDYVEKSKEKTALLFQTGILTGLIVGEHGGNEELKNTAIEFAQNFGIAFQIRDDLINILNSDELKPNLNDLESGIYTAPVIFAYQQDKTILTEPSLDRIKSAGGIVKTKSLMDNYFDKAIRAIANFEENEYKSALVGLIGLLRESI